MSVPKETQVPLGTEHSGSFPNEPPFAFVYVGVVFEEGSPSVTQAGPELEIPTLNLQEAGIRGS